MATLNKVKQMNDTQVQNWLRKVGRGDVAKLGIALLGAEDEVRKIIYKNMSHRAGIFLQADLEKYKKLSIDDKTISDYAGDLEKLM